MNRSNLGIVAAGALGAGISLALPYLISTYPKEAEQVMLYVIAVILAGAGAGIGILIYCMARGRI